MNDSFIRHAFLILVVCASCAKKAEDNSLTIDAYRELGIPDPDKKWTMADYSQAHNVLAKLKWERQRQLPVKDSEKSGSLFKRMISLDYLSFLRDSTISRNEKARRISEFGVVHDYWMDVYSVPTINDNYYSSELMDLRIFNLNLSEAAFNLASQIMQSDDPSDVALQYGYPNIKQAYLECLNNYLQPRSYVPSRASWQEFSEEDLERMIDSVHLSVERNRKWLLDNDVKELIQTLRAVSDSTSSEVIRIKYERLKNDLSS